MKKLLGRISELNTMIRTCEWLLLKRTKLEKLLDDLTFLLMQSFHGSSSRWLRGVRTYATYNRILPPY